jgi:hypothetical protein
VASPVPAEGAARVLVGLRGIERPQAEWDEYLVAAERPPPRSCAAMVASIRPTRPLLHTM